VVKALELKLYNNKPEKIKKYYSMYIASPYGVNYSVSARIYRLRLKSIVNWEAYQIMKLDCERNRKDNTNAFLDLMFILSAKKENMTRTKAIFGTYFDWEKDDPILPILEQLVSDSIFCLKEIIRLSKTVGESYLFNHSFMGKIYQYLADWIIIYQSIAILKEIKIDLPITDKAIAPKLLIEACDEFKKEKEKDGKTKECCTRINKRLEQSHIEEHLEYFLGEDWKEQLSGHYETNQALSHYYLCKETHTGGRAYMNIIENMSYIKEDFNDRANHFNIAIERFMIGNEVIDKNIENLKKRYKESGLYKVDNYFEK
jgi:hypothetical protein